MPAKILCNGVPKSGTHALAKAVQLLGQQTTLAHAPYENKPEGKSIHIVRNPRDTIVSWMRFTRTESAQGFLIGAFDNFYELPLYEQFAGYAPYKDDKDVLTVRFEDLISTPKTLEDIAEYLEVPMLSDAFDRLPGLTVTWTGKLSNWADHWTNEVETAWVKARGPEVEAMWNY